MKKMEILIKVQEIFRDVFDDDTLEISLITNSNDIEDWDSLNNINIILAIEKEFNIKLQLAELYMFVNVGNIIDLVENKINN